MSSDALGALLRARMLPATAREPLEALLTALEREDAPTTIHARRRAVDEHLADSLAALDLPEVQGAVSLVDLGAGAGLPGLALAAALPAAEVALAESTGKKCEFLRRTVEEMGLEDRVSVACTRVEEWPDGLASFDVATSRALAALPVLVEYAAPLLRPDGLLVAWKGRRDPEEERAGTVAAAKLGMEVTEVRAVRPYRAAEHRHLHVLRKIGPTPAGYPRRPGMAVKRPLGRSASDRARQ